MYKEASFIDRRPLAARLHSRTCRVVTRLFGNDLRMLERFQHASRKAPPQVRDATVAWYDPESGLDLFPYASCGTAALEWGLTPTSGVACVSGGTRRSFTMASSNRGWESILGLVGTEGATLSTTTTTRR